MALGWWRRRLACTILVVLLAAVASGCGFGGSGSHSGKTVGEVSDISGAALQKSDGPAGYNQLYSRLFSKYDARMQLGQDVTCGPAKGVTSANWKQGLAAELVKSIGSGNSNNIIECIFLLNSDAAAHPVYKGRVSFAESYSGPNYVSLPKLGQEQEAINNSSTYSVIFRHHNAVVALDYISNGTADVSFSDFRKLAVNVNSRLK